MIKQNKKAPVIAAMAFTTLLSQAAWANEEATLSAPVFEANELSYAFEHSAEPMQMLALSEQEMKETEGAWWWSAAFAAVGGIANSGLYLWNSPNPTWGGAAFAFGTGAHGAFVASLPGSRAWQVGYSAYGAVVAGYPNRW